MKYVIMDSLGLELLIMVVSRLRGHKVQPTSHLGLELLIMGWKPCNLGLPRTRASDHGGLKVTRPQGPTYEPPRTRASDHGMEAFVLFCYIYNVCIL